MMRPGSRPPVAVMLLVLLALAAPGARAQEDSELSYWLENAKVALRQGDRGDALAYLERVLSEDPGNPEALALKARLGDPGVVEAAPSPDPEGLGEAMAGVDPGVTPELALELLRQEPYREDAPRLRRLLGAHYLKLAQAAERGGPKGEGMVAFRRAAFFAGDDPLVRYEFFQALMRRERLEEALKEAEAFLALQSQGALAKEMDRQLLEVHTRLGEKQMKANRWDVAIRHLRKVVRKVPPEVRGFGEVEEKLAVCFYTLGVREAANGRGREACEAFSNLLELRPAAGDGQARFDRQYMGKLRRSALSPLWGQGKTGKEQGRLLEAHRYLGHVLTLGTEAWMLKLADQYRKEIEELAGPSVRIEERRRRLGLAPEEPLPEDEAAALRPLLEGAAGTAATSEGSLGIPTLAELLHGGRRPLPSEPPTALAALEDAGSPEAEPEAAYDSEAAGMMQSVAGPATRAPESPEADAPPPDPEAAPPPGPAPRWIPGSGTPPPWLRGSTPAPAPDPVRAPPPGAPRGDDDWESGLGYEGEAP